MREHYSEKPKLGDAAVTIVLPQTSRKTLFHRSGYPPSIFTTATFIEKTMFDVDITGAFYGNSIWRWLAALLLIILSIVLGKMMYWISGNIVKKLAAKTKTELDDILVDMLEEPIIMIGTLVCIWYSLQILTFKPAINEWIGKIFYILVVFNIAWLVIRTVDALVENYIVPLVDKTETEMDDVLLPIIRNLFKVAVCVLAIIVALNNAGYDVGAIIAGMGIGGLALAMASKETLSNMFGGITIMLSRPFTIGQRIRVSGVDGWVTEIGLRVTKVSDFCSRIHYIPNKKFIDSIVENVDLQTSHYEVRRLHLRYDTTADQMQKAMDIVRNIAREFDLFENDTWICFDKVGDYSLEMEYWYFIKKWSPDEKATYPIWFDKVVAARNIMHFEILKRFGECGLKLAMPTRVRAMVSSSNNIFSGDMEADAEIPAEAKKFYG